MFHKMSFLPPPLGGFLVEFLPPPISLEIPIEHIILSQKKVSLTANLPFCHFIVNVNFQCFLRCPKFHLFCIVIVMLGKVSC